jgi:hypothetical protein
VIFSAHCRTKEPAKGILLTTSGYRQASFEFAQNKPIELIDGANLLCLLAEHAGVEAKIVSPDNWKDPAADTPKPKTERPNTTGKYSVRLGNVRTN